MMRRKLLVLLTCALVVLGGAGIAACTNDPPPEEPVAVLKTESNQAGIDVYSVTYVAIDLPALFEKLPEGAAFQATSGSEHLTVSNVSSAGKLNVISDGTTGDYTVSVKVIVDGKEVFSFSVGIAVTDSAPAPEVKKELEDVAFDAPVFPDPGKTYIEYSLDLSEYFDAADNVAYTMTGSDDSVTMTASEADPYLVTLVFTEFGEKEIRIGAVQKGEEKAFSEFTATVTASTPAQLINGDFEQDYTGWDLDSWAKAAYSIYDSNVDIWGNGVDNDGKYLYGYYNESGTCEFTSSVFVAQGSGYITWKMAGNCTERLQFVLMQYNEEGEDVEIAKFNNWYFGVYAGSGFIFREYYYQIPQEYLGSKCYFKVVDEASAEETGFSFINLDSIVTYYETAPVTDAMYPAGYCVSPEGGELDMSDTSKDPFPTDLSTVPYQLVNGDFESGYTGWYMTTEEKNAYAIYGSKTDIWNNPVNATNNYLYGYANEGFAAANFHSSLFKAGGSGMITWKMAGNSTADLQFVLMRYDPEGEDTVIATFNNWYYPISQESGFIFRNYYYQLDMETYGDSYLYFVVKDYKAADFGFICLDDIVTYYETAPSFGEGWFKAGYVTDPDAASSTV